MLESEKILPKEDRIEESYQNSEVLNCIQDWEDKYGDFEDAIYMIDKYHLALIASESQTSRLQILVKNNNKEIKTLESTIEDLRKVIEDGVNKEFCNGEYIKLQNKNKELLKKCRELNFQDHSLKLDLLERNELNPVLYSEEAYLSMKNDKDKEIKEKEEQIKNFKNGVEDLNFRLKNAQDLIDIMTKEN